MTQEEIILCLNDPKDGERNRRLLAFCSEPKTFAEMERGSTIKGAGLFKSLVDLKKSGAIIFVDGKYVASQPGAEALKNH